MQLIHPGNTGDVDRYWYDVDDKAGSSGWYAYTPFRVEIPGFYTVSDLFSYCWFLPDDESGKVSLSDLVLYDSSIPTIYLPTTGWIYLSAKVRDITFSDFVYSSNQDRKVTYFVDVTNNYSKVSDVTQPYQILSDKYVSSGSGVSVSGKTYTCNQDDVGVVSYVQFSTSNSRFVIDYRYTFAGTDTNCRLYVRHYKTDGTVQYDRIRIDTQPGEIHSRTVYSTNSTTSSYEVLIFGNTGASITMKYLLVYEPNEVQYTKFYDVKLDKMLANLSQGIESNANLASPQGKKYRLIIGNNGQVLAYPIIPKKFIAIGNSITCGMSDPLLGNFGMAATSYQEDWVYHLYEYIHAKESTAQFSRIYASPLEHCETLQDAEQYIEDTEPYLTSDADLVVIEIGDNVNTDTKRNIFRTSFPEFIQSIRSNCQHARVVVMGIWFNNVTKQILQDTCDNYNLEFVDISNLHTSSNEAVVGDTIHYSDGTTGTITSSIATHPGNRGMYEIANRLIQFLEV